MNKIKIILTSAILIVSTGINIAQISENDFEVFNYKTKIEEGKTLEKNLLLKNEKNVIANVTLRENKAMGVHTEKNAFWVIATAGNGKLVLGKNEKIIDLTPGIMVTVKPGIPHDVIAEPELSILVIKFLTNNPKEK